MNPNQRIRLTRRHLLQSGLLLAGGLAVSGCAAGSPTTHGGGSHRPTTPFLKTGRAPDPAFKPDLDVQLTAQTGAWQALPGALTHGLQYVARVLAGDPAQLQTIGANGLPLLKVQTGQRLRLRFQNALPEEKASNIHWHGLRPPQQMDGHPDHVIAPGVGYAYEFEITDQAMTAWFHPHVHGDTARQVYMGLAGMLLVQDAAEQALGLPDGPLDLPIILQDRQIDKDNQLLYFGHGMVSGPMEQMMGFYGDRLLVNGRADAVIDVPARAHRLRVLNGSNANIYKLAWSDGMPLVVLGTDAGLLAAPVQRRYVMLAPGERVELWGDFAGRRLGERVSLISQEFDGVEDVDVPPEYLSKMRGVTQMRMHTDPGPGHAVQLLRFNITRSSSESHLLPKILLPDRALLPANVQNAASPRSFKISHKAMQWQFNGRAFDDTVETNETVRQGATEVWAFENGLNLGESMDPMGMAHPIHIHGVHFNVIERSLLVPELSAGYKTVRDGWLDEGRKDTVLLMPGERVKILVQFLQQPGKYVYHCHNLEHEDQGLMRNYQVRI